MATTSMTAMDVPSHPPALLHVHSGDASSSDSTCSTDGMSTSETVSSFDPTTQARKRRREILTTTQQRHTDVANTKRLKLSPKKPQMKYDPEVPMTKTEAAQWRREQRRKRNRESAAASRQRQRDRIQELELEVDGWKDKYQEILRQIECLEQDKEPAVISTPFLTAVTPSMTDTKITTPSTDSRPQTPPPTPHEVTPRASPTSSCAFVSIDTPLNVKSQELQDEINNNDEIEPSKMISRHASSKIIHLILT